MTRGASAILALTACTLFLVPGSGGSDLGLRVPPGFRVSVFAGGLQHPTALQWGPGGFLYATEDVGKLVATRRGSARPRVLLTGLRVPLGLAWWGRTLFVSEQGRIERMRLVGRRFTSRRAIVLGLPYGRHQQDNIAIGSDRRLYFGNGSTCNACAERDRRSAAILSVRMDGRDLRIVASGLRNPYGLAFQPRSRRLYASVNGRDDLGSSSDPEPADTIVRVRGGSWYGWPDCWADYAQHRLSGACSGVADPVAYLAPHSSADGIVFYTARSFGSAYRGNLFVAEWGQYGSHAAGREIVRVDVRPDGTAGSVSTFATGLQHPLALAVDRRGALLVADWGCGVIYSIQRIGAS